MSQCKDNKDAINIAIENHNESSDFYDDYLDSKVEEDAEIVPMLDDNVDFERGVLFDIDKEKITKQFINQYGKDGERMAAANLIYGILKNNPILVDPIFAFIITHLGEGVVVGEEGKIKFSRLPIETLNLVYAWLGESTRESLVADFDGFIARRITPKERAKRDPSHAFFIMEQATRDHATNIAKRINEFKKDNPLSSTEGMDGVLNEVRELVFDLPGIDIEMKMEGLFNRFQHGWIYIDEVKDSPTYGELMIYEGQQQPKVNEKGYIQTYDDGTIMYGWTPGSGVPLKNFTPPNKPKGDWYIPLSKERIARLKHLKQKARNIYKEVADYTIPEMERSTDKLMTVLAKGTGGKLSAEELKLVFFRDKLTKLTPTGEIDLLENLDETEKEFVMELKKTIDFSANDEIVISNGGKLDLSEIRMVDELNNYFPKIINRDRFVDVLNTTIKRLKRNIEGLIINRDTDKDDDGNPLSPEDRKSVKKILKSFQGQLNHANVVRDRLQGLHDESSVSGGNPFGFAKDNKYFKSVSNAYDIRQMRVDSGVFFDYLHAQMSSIERNLLAAKFAEAFMVSKSKNEPEMHDVVNSAMLNLYKVLFHRPDIEGTFSKGPLKNFFGSVENLNDSLNKMRPGRNKTPEQTQRTLRTMSGWLTGWYLGGPNTVVQNMLDKYRNIIDHGLEAYQKSIRLLKDSDKRPNINKIIQASGIISFSDFFSDVMVNGVLDIRLEQEVSMGILKATMNYHYKVKKGIKRSIAEKEFREEIQFYLDNSSAITKAEDIEIMAKDKDFKHAKKKTKAAMFDLRQRIRNSKVNRLVENAIKHEYVYSPMLKKVSWKSYVGMTAGKAIELYNSALHAVGFTMDKTEQYIRSVSFVIGANRAQESGMVKTSVPWYDLDINRKVIDFDTGKERSLTPEEIKKEEEDIAKIIQIGKEYSYFTNFALSTQGVGQNYWGGVGNLWGKFNYWSIQKFGSDVRIFKEAYQSNKNFRKVKNDSFSWSTAAQTVKKVFTTRNARTTNPAIARLRAFLLIQGPTTLIWDWVSLSIPAIGIIRTFAYASGQTKSTRGFTSDVLSLFFIPLLLAIKLGTADDDDDEEWDKMMKTYTRKLWFGFVPTWGFETIISMLSAISSEQKRAYEDVTNQMRVFMGGSTLIGSTAVGGANWLLKEDEKDED